MTPLDRPSLNVLIVAPDRETGTFASRVLEDHDDSARVAEGVPEALHRLTRDRVDVVLVSLSLPRGDGLALVHHLRALHPEIDVIVMAHPKEIEESAHAMALGVLASVVLPLTGDGLMVAVDRARERRVLLAERARLAAEGEESRRRSATYARCAAFVSETDLSAVAARILDACAGEVGARAGAIYVPSPGDDRLHRAAVVGDEGPAPMWIDAKDVVALDPTDVVSVHGDRLRVLLMADAQAPTLIELLLDGHQADTAAASRDSLAVIAALGSAALSAARKVDAISRTGLKDPETSAYTFAYFGDVAGREIDRAARHSRKFALMTLTLDALEDARTRCSPSELTELRRSVTDKILAAVRDSDVVARVEDDEIYVLLPESGLLGSLAARTRIVSSLREIDREPAVGVAVFPADGRDLGRLLRASRLRAERSRNGVWRRLGLGRHAFWTAVERLLGSEDDAAVGRDGTVALHADLRLAHDDAALARHAAIPRALVPRIAESVANDAIAHDLPGTLYVAGDRAAAAAVARAMDAVEQPRLRAWSLGPSNVGSESAQRIHITVDDPRLEDRVMLLSLTELGGYAMVARPIASGQLLAYHSADLDLVDGLVRAAQAAYRLQPEVR